MLARNLIRTCMGGGVALLLAGLCVAQGGTIPLYIVNGVENKSPPDQIDAFAYANYGQHSVNGFIYPYDFLNTRYFTNRGTMFASPGFRIETASDTEPSRPAAHFLNEVDAVVSVGNYLRISADRLENHGVLQAGPQSLIQIEGGTVDLSRGDINIETFGGFGSTDFVTTTNFIPAANIFDNYWGGPTNINFDVDTSFYELDTNFGPIVTSPIYGATNTFGQGLDRIFLAFPLTGVRTNQIDETNAVVQAIFVGYETNLLSGQVRFSTFNTQNDFAVAGASLSMEFTNSVTGVISAENLYVTDEMAARTNNLAILVNANTGNSYRPSNYRVSRAPLLDFQFGGAGNSPPTPNLFYEEGVSSNVNVTALYTAYSADVASLAGLTPPPIPGATDSNLLGRLEIEAETLDLSRVKARANSLMSIKAAHVISTGKSEFEAGSYRFDLASTNGTLQVDSKITGENKAFDGPVYMWSALWTNFSEFVGTNLVVTNEPPVTNEVLVTNILTTGYHVLLVDAYSLGITGRTSFSSLKLRADTVEIDHPYFLTGELFIEATNLVLNESVTFLGGLGDFGSSNAPSLMSLTNYGTFEIANDAIFGADRPVHYKNLVNEGTIQAASMVVRSDFVHNKGDFDVNNVLRVEAGVAKFESGLNVADGDMILQARDMKFHNFDSQTLGTLLINATNSLSDSGGQSGSSLSCNRGFRLLRKPTLGDLLGTRLVTQVSDKAVIDHTWAGADRGVSVDGFKNNVAVGQLVLSAGLDAVLRFHGLDATGQYAIYADYLDLQGFVGNAYDNDRLEEVLEIDPNVTIYYAYANKPVESLDGALGGRLRWIKEFAGPNSSVVVALPSGASVQVNQGLRESIIIDSDGDGLANGYDPQPFSEPDLEVTVTALSPLTMSIAWSAAPLTTYQLEFQDDPEGTWTLLQTVTNESTVMQEALVQDVVSSPNVSRYYRVRYNP